MTRTIVDKIIISQASLGAFINTLLPHSYRSVTKIDFSRLDAIRVRPLGIYGSKSEIVRLLLSLGAVTPETYVNSVSAKNLANRLS
jgi:hypothetical protein